MLHDVKKFGRSVVVRVLLPPFRCPLPVLEINVMITCDGELDYCDEEQSRVLHNNSPYCTGYLISTKLIALTASHDVDRTCNFILILLSPVSPLSYSPRQQQ